MTEPRGDPMGMPMPSGKTNIFSLNLQKLGDTQLPNKLRNFSTRGRGTPVSLNLVLILSRVGWRGMWGNRPVTSKDAKIEPGWGYVLDLLH